MIFPDGEVVVVDLAGNYAKLVVSDPARVVQLRGLGFVNEGDRYVRAIHGHEDRKDLAHALVGLNAIFSAGPNWSPSELMGYYADEGEVFKPYRVISWTGAGAYFVE